MPKTTIDWVREGITGHVMKERPSRSFDFRTPDRGSIYAFSLTWTPGSLILAGDIGELTLTHWHAMQRFEASIAWAMNSDTDYLLGKSDKKREFDKDATIAFILEYAAQCEHLTSQLVKVLYLPERIWGAALTRALPKALRYELDELGAEGVAQWIRDNNLFDDWFGARVWTEHNRAQIAAIQHGCRMILASLPEKAEAA